MMKTTNRFRQIPKRDDISDIVQKSTSDTVPIKESDEDHWSTLYKETFSTHKIARVPPAKAPSTGINIGGGNLSPTKEEMESNYSQFFKKFERTDVPPIAEPVPNSDIVKMDYPIPESTLRSAMKEIEGKKNEYDTSGAKSRVEEARKAHFFFGSDERQFQTTYEKDFPGREYSKPASFDLALMKSSVTFDPIAGAGPNSKKKNSTEKQIISGKYEKSERSDQNHCNFDIGYDSPYYTTTTKSSLYSTPKLYQRPESFKAPSCAKFSNHGEYAAPWETTNSTDFKTRKAEPNIIDKADLRATHFDVGLDKTDWPQRIVDVPTKRPTMETIDLQESNIVFKGDETGYYQTTSQDLIGVHNSKIDGRGRYVNAREDHLFLGGDKIDYSTETKTSQKFAGKGKPAKPSADLHLMRGVGFASGGTFDPKYGEDLVEEKPVIMRGTPQKIDTKYFTQSHFTLDATKSNKTGYETSYYTDICKPKLM